MPVGSSQLDRRPEFSIVMPAFNEGDLPVATVAALVEVLSGEPSYEIVLVDDGSSDDTWEAVCAASRRFPMVRGVRFTRNFGHQAALMAGLQHARGRAVITMDSDGEHPVEVVPRMLDAWRRGAKVVQGVRREARQLSAFKRWTSRTFYRLFSWLAGTPLQPGSADFRLLDRSVVDVILAHRRASGFLRGFIPWTGFATVEIPFEQGVRAAGVSKFTTAKMVGLARKGIVGFSVKPLRLSLILGFVTCGFALVNLAYALVMRLWFPEQVVPGWTTLAGLVALIGGVQLVVIGILGEYLAVMFEALRDQPEFIVGEIVESPGGHVAGVADAAADAGSPDPQDGGDGRKGQPQE